MPAKRRQRCGRCKRSLALDKFAPSKRGKSGKWCIACFKEHQQQKRRPSERQRSIGGMKARRSTKARLWNVSLSHRYMEMGLTDNPALVFSCKGCRRIVRPIFHKSYISHRKAVIDLICPRCKTGGTIEIDARHAAA